jgi:hypothetical protein
MATYLVLIYGDEAVWEAESPKEIKTQGRRTCALQRSRRGRRGGQRTTAGEPDGSEPPLEPARASRGDGWPFLESKEVIGGYYVIDATDRNEVVEYARLLPELSGDHGGVEIWPLVERR